MDVPITSATKQQYFSNLDDLVRERASAYDRVPSWGSYVGNGVNDAWNKADAALRTWPSLNPPLANIGYFPRNAGGARAAVVALKMVEAAEARAGEAGAGDPLNVGFHGDPEQGVAQAHDFELGVAAAQHDLGKALAANHRFAMDSLQCAAAARAMGDAAGAARDEAAAMFIEVGANGVGLGAPAVHAVHAGASAVERAAAAKVGQAAEIVVRAERAPLEAALRGAPAR